MAFACARVLHFRIREKKITRRNGTELVAYQKTMRKFHPLEKGVLVFSYIIGRWGRKLHKIQENRKHHGRALI